VTTTIDSLSRIAASDGRRTARNGAADALAHAFSADPLFTHFFPDQDNRRALSVHTFRFIVTHGLANGEVTVADAAGEIAGAAVWVPGENADRGIIDQARHGALPMLWRQPPAAVWRQMQGSGYMEKLHASLGAEPHFYLKVLGLQPQWRGRGLASQLLAPMLKRADEQRRACYLDTHNQDNVSLYRRYGFEVVHEGTMAESSVNHWVMIRPAG